jgi:hypothetical protein
MEDADVIIRFSSAVTSCDVYMAQFAVRHGCHAFARLLRDPTARLGEETATGTPVIHYTLEPLVAGTRDAATVPCAITPDILQLFFSLFRVLVTRSMSDGVLYDSVARARHSREQDVIHDASEYILHMHNLALRFICPRVRIWAERVVLRLLNEDNAPSVCAYVLEAAPDTGQLTVRLGCEALMHQFVLWYYCVNDARAATAFNASANTLLSRLQQRDQYDPFQPRIHVDEANRTVRIGGYSVRCAACRGTTLCYIGMHQNALHLVSIDTPANGYWSGYIVEDAVKGHSFTLVHVPGDVAQAHARQATDADVHTREEALYRAALQTPARPGQADLAFKCDVEIGVYRRISRTGSSVPETLVLRNAIVAARDRTLVDAQNQPLAVVAARFALPPATLDQPATQWTWYDGTCQACHAQKPVSILSYRMSIMRIPLSACADSVEGVTMARN